MNFKLRFLFEIACLCGYTYVQLKKNIQLNDCVSHTDKTKRYHKPTVSKWEGLADIETRDIRKVYTRHRGYKAFVLLSSCNGKSFWFLFSIKTNFLLSDCSECVRLQLQCASLVNSIFENWKNSGKMNCRRKMSVNHNSWNVWLL